MMCAFVDVNNYSLLMVAMMRMMLKMVVVLVFSMMTSLYPVEPLSLSLVLFELLMKVVNKEVNLKEKIHSILNQLERTENSMDTSLVERLMAFHVDFLYCADRKSSMNVQF